MATALQVSLNHQIKPPPPTQRCPTLATNCRLRSQHATRLGKRREISNYYEDGRHQKSKPCHTRNERCILTTSDLTGPTPCTYSPPRRGLQETNSPAYTMGVRHKGKVCLQVGGGRTAWSKPWFATDNVWTIKTRYESNWPSVMDYDIPVTLGHYVCFGNQQPSFTMQPRKHFGICRQDAEEEPAPNAYCRESSERAVLRQSPSYTFPRIPASRHLWQFISDTPGPGAYDPYMHLCRPRSLAFSFGLTGKRFQ